MKHSKRNKRDICQPHASTCSSQPTPPSVRSLLQAAGFDTTEVQLTMPAQALMIWVNGPSYHASHHQYLYHNQQPLTNPFAFYCDHTLYVIDVGYVQVQHPLYLILIDNQGYIGAGETALKGEQLGTVIESHPYCLSFK